MQQMVPHSGFNTITEYPCPQRVITQPGRIVGVYITLLPQALEDIAAKITGWFQGREEVSLVDVGVSDKRGFGFILIEWIECDIDPLFLAILRDEEVVGDYTTYGRLLED